MTVPIGWLPPAKMQRIICHWTAGGYTANSTDKRHYHILIEGDGKLVRGNPSISLNEAPVKSGYAAHTLNCNSGSIGVSLCCMAGAIERPFNAGRYPMKRVQWDRLIEVLAALCKRYDIAVTPKTVLSHAEVQGNLGIKQRGKWNFTRLAFDPSIVVPGAVGEKLRSEVLAMLVGDEKVISDHPTSESDQNVRPLGTVSTDWLNMREQASGSSRVIGQLATGDKVEINRSVMNGDTEWLSVIAQDTRQWAWVAARFVDRD